jgi:hypothetical protein
MIASSSDASSTVVTGHQPAIVSDRHGRADEASRRGDPVVGDNHHRGGQERTTPNRLSRGSRSAGFAGEGYAREAWRWVSQVTVTAMASSSASRLSKPWPPPTIVWNSHAGRAPAAALAMS